MEDEVFDCVVGDLYRPFSCSDHDNTKRHQKVNNKQKIIVIRKGWRIKKENKFSLENYLPVNHSVYIT